MDNIINAATLNFSGINLSYFEYDDGSELFDSLNQKYKLIKDKEFPTMKAWKGSGLDKKYKEHRYTVLSGELFINRLGNRLPSKQEFESEWMRIYEEAKSQKMLTKDY